MNNDFLNYKFSKENKLIIENIDHHKLKIIADESANLKILEHIAWSFKKPYKVKWEQSDRFNVILEEKFTNHNDFSEFSAVQDELKINDVIKELENSNDILDTQEDAPIVKLFNLILKEAISRKASDVHRW